MISATIIAFMYWAFFKIIGKPKKFPINWEKVLKPLAALAMILAILLKGPLS